MRKAVKDLFWEIVNCPWKGQSASDCSEILAVQNGRSNRQVPEPWSGSLETASYLMLGANPAFDKDEVFPSKLKTGKWDKRCSGGHFWTDGDAEKFFEGRFCEVQCDACGKNLPYVRNGPSNLDILKLTSAGTCEYKQAQNGYWMAYSQYAKAIADKAKAQSPTLSKDIVVTDVVHCKGGKEIGVSQALPHCQEYTKRIIDAFLSNSATSTRSILVFGSENSRKVKKAMEVIQAAIGNLQKVQLAGEYYYKRCGKDTKKQINHWKLMKNAVMDVDVFTNIPAPSASNHAAHDVKFFGKTIVWSKKEVEAMNTRELSALSKFNGGKLTRKASYVACNTNPIPKGADARKIIYRVDALADQLRVRMYTCECWNDTLHALFKEKRQQLGVGWTWSMLNENGIEKRVSTVVDALAALNQLYDAFDLELRRCAANI